MRRILTIAIATLTIGALLAACGGGPGAGGSGEVIVGSKEFTEQLLLGQITIQLLEQAGFEPVDQTGLGGTDVNREALVNGEIDVYWEYTGTAWLVHLAHEEAITDPAEAYDSVKAEDLEQNGLVWLEPAAFNNTYTLMMQSDQAEELGIQSLSDLSAYVSEHPEEITLATNAEFAVRPDGYPALADLYGFQFPDNKIVQMETGLTYKALRDGEVNVAMGFATDGRIRAFELTNLDDDRKFFPVYNPAPVLREDFVSEHPAVRDALNPVAAELDTATMTELNYLVDVEGESVEDVAHDWLHEVGLLTD